MKTAKDLFLTYLESFRDIDKTTELFAEDGVIEIPYFSELGWQTRYKGHTEIRNLIKFVFELYPDWKFTNINIFIDTPLQACAEYEVFATAAATRRQVHQLFFGRLVIENGKIKLLREALNIIAAAKAVLPNGLADVK